MRADLADGLQERLSLSWSGNAAPRKRNSRRKSGLVNAEDVEEEEDIPWSEKLLRIHESLMCVIIFANCITMGIEMDCPWTGWFWVNQGMLIAYVVDITLRLFYAESLYEFVRGGWNWLDSIIVISSILDMWIIPYVMVKKSNKPSFMGSVAVVMRLPRLLRIFRILTVVKAVKPLYNLVLGLSEAFSAIIWFLILVCILLYCFALIFHQIFSRGWESFSDEEDEEAKAVFATVIHSFFSLFRAMSQDYTDMGPILSSAKDYTLIPWWMCFQMCSKWLLLSTLTATVIDTVLGSKAKRERAEEFRRVQDEREHVEEHLQDAFSEMADECDDIHRADLLEYLGNEENREAMRKLINKEPFELLQDWEAMQMEGAVQVDDFIEHLQAGAHTNTSGALHRVESRVQRLQTSMDQVVTYLPMLRNIADGLDAAVLDRVAELTEEGPRDAAALDRVAELTADGPRFTKCLTRGPRCST